MNRAIWIVWNLREGLLDGVIGSKKILGVVALSCENSDVDIAFIITLVLVYLWILNIHFLSFRRHFKPPNIFIKRK
tara:strand:+ start:148 stop:375 length:228 start_codon:yes stop_codon:yes gene_type:complete